MKTLGIVFLAIVMLALGYRWWQRGPDIRYRVTATVQSGGKLYTGTGVIQISINLQQIWTPAVSAHARGDAIVINVPGHSPVFVLLSGERDADWAASIPFELFRDQLGRASLRDRSNALATQPFKAELPVDKYPMLVAFRDLNVPASVYQVLPDKMSPPLDPGARLVSMTIEMTRDPVTYQIDDVLPWLSRIRGNLLGKSMVTTSELADNLGEAAFRKRGT